MSRIVAGWSLIALTTLAGAAVSASGCGDDGTGTAGTGGGSTASSTGSTSGSGGSGGSDGSTSSVTSSTGGSAMMKVMIPFEGRVGKTPFTCKGTYPGIGTAATDVALSDFRLYIHDVKLHQKGGADVAVELMQDGLWQYKNLALLDFEDKSGPCANGTTEMNAMIHAVVPQGTYDGISFKLGVPFELDHADASTAPSPLNLSGLFWDWNSGYKFLRADSAPTAGGAPFLLHLGSTACQGNFADGGISGCDRPNVADVVLTGFDPAKSKVVVDYAAVVAGSDLSKNEGGAPGCMSGPTDPECDAIFQRLGLSVKDSSTHPDQQKLFSVE
jgi:uncharacterized repeat protein (TIGR04052 family)